MDHTPTKMPLKAEGNPTPFPLILLPWLSLWLSSCATPSETFDCPAGKGIGCRSVSEVNTMVNEGRFRGRGEEDGPPTVPPSSAAAMPMGPSPVGPVGSLAGKTSWPHPPIPVSSSFIVHRVPETYRRVWIAPFQDGEGNFHDGSLVYTVLKPGSWQMASLPPCLEAFPSPPSSLKEDTDQEVP